MASLKATAIVSIKQDQCDKQILNNEEEEDVWEDLKICNNYEISRKYPYPIRNKRTKHTLKDWNDDHGYRRLQLHFGDGTKKFYNNHVLITNQWIPNDDPEHKPEVDHINRIRSDNHISNLRWVSKSVNSFNRNSFNNVNSIWHKELPPTAEPFTNYYHHKFENIFIDKTNKKLYLNNEAGEFREIIPHTDARHATRYSLRDTNNQSIDVSHNVLFEDKNTKLTVSELPETAEPLLEYGNNKLKNTYIDKINHKVYLFNTKVSTYTEQKPHLLGKSQIIYYTRTVNEKAVRLSYNKLFDSPPPNELIETQTN